jgi:hypothetical protein
MSNFVDTLLALVNSNESDMDLKAQCAWALGNIAGEAAYYRQELMIAGFTTSVVNILNTIYEYIHNNAMEGSFGYSKWQLLHDNMYANVEALLWTLSNMSRGGFRTAEFYQLVSHYYILKK